MQGRIDLVRPEGIVEGWCWDEATPNERIKITVLVDGVEAGNGLASLYRDDLRQAKIGDGFHAFAVILSALAPKSKRLQTFVLVDTATRTTIGTPFVYYNRNVLSFDDRLLELESRNRLLESRLAELTQRAQEIAAPPSELFSVVGAFFTRLANDMARGIHPASLEQRLEGILQTATQAHPVINLSVPDRQAMTVLIEASSCSLAQLHACLASLHRAGAGAMAQIVVLDTGAVDEVALVPSVVRGIRYVRTIADLSSEWAEAERGDESGIVVLLNGRAVADPNLLTEWVDGFARTQRAGAIGGVAVGQDGAPHHGGLHLRDGKLVDGIVSAGDEAAAELAAAHFVHALSHHAAAFRRSALRAVGGLDGAFGNDLGAGIIDVCFRLRQAGWSVAVQPFATLKLQPDYAGESWVTPGLGGPSRAGDLLRTRWLGSPIPPRPLRAGRAAVLGQPDSFDDELRAVHQLHSAEFGVLYLGPADMAPDHVRALQRAGAAVTLTPDTGDVLIGSGIEIVYATTPDPALEVSSEGSLFVVGAEALLEALIPSSQCVLLAPDEILPQLPQGAAPESVH
jgi:hypothetical protein